MSLYNNYADRDAVFPEAGRSPVGQVSFGEAGSVLKGSKKSGLGRASRLPLGDKTPNTNIAHASRPHKKPKYKNGRSLSRENGTSRTPRAPPTPTDLPTLQLQALPSIPHPSSLRLHLNDHSRLSIPSPSRARRPSSASALPSTPPAIRQAIQQIKDLPKPAPSTPAYIPVLHHPNSPYVPWDRATRRKILRPSTAASCGSATSRPPSRSGARAPEPMQQSPTRRASDVGQLVSGARVSLKMRMKSAVKRLGMLKALLRRDSSAQAASSPRRSKHHPSTLGANSRVDDSTSPLSPSPDAVNVSATSLHSSGTDTLAVWLASRRRASLAEDLQVQARPMTVEEYEQLGSWLDLPRAEREARTECGVHIDSGVSVHSPKGISYADVGYEIWSTGALYTPRRRARTGREGGAKPRPMSYPQFTPSRSGREVLSTAGDTSRALDMPGGWGFSP